jgi:hypothetical protein
MSDLLDRAIEAHGGLDRWHGVRAIDVVFNFSGGLLDLKEFPGHHRPAVSVDTLKPRAVLQRLHGDPDDRWKFFTPMPGTRFYSSTSKSSQEKYWHSYDLSPSCAQTIEQTSFSFVGSREARGKTRRDLSSDGSLKVL